VEPVKRVLVTSGRASLRLARAQTWLAQVERGQPLTIVSDPVDGAAQLARSVLGASEAAFGWQNFTPRRLALRQAAPVLRQRGWAVASPVALDAVWVQVISRLEERKHLGRFAVVSDRPGLPQALQRTVHELRMARVPRETLDPDLRCVLDAFVDELEQARLADLALVFQCACNELSALAESCLVRHPVLLLDAPLVTPSEAAWLCALVGISSDVMATVPAGDDRTLQVLRDGLGVAPESITEPGRGSLARLQHQLFSTGRSQEIELDDQVSLFSASDESLECAQIARHIQREARGGLPFDEMAVLLRTPAYRPHVEQAFRRAGIPSYFAQGTRAPDPAGRALLSLLACAHEQLSARRFAEYLSLGETPYSGAQPPALADAPSTTESSLPALSSPRRWERILVEAAVMGGLDRWRQRLNGLRSQWEWERAIPNLPEAQRQRLDRRLEDLSALQMFALPLLEDLAALPPLARWKDWLQALVRLAERALRSPSPVVDLLLELGPMGAAGPVSLPQVRAVLSRSLSDLCLPMEERRAGRVLVASVEAARGVAFEVVFVPGLAERVFPQKVAEDPVLLDAARRTVSLTLERNEERVSAERFALRLAAGAARQRLELSYPRMNADHGRPRVPSFYALEVIRAIEGKLPGFGELARRADAVTDTRLSWPAPRDPAHAIDDTEYDLASLQQAWNAPDDKRGAAYHLTHTHPHLSRSLARLQQQHLPAWCNHDGLYSPTPVIQNALRTRALDVQPYSITSLQAFSACPYRFFLQTIQRLSPRDEPAPFSAERCCMTSSITFSQGCETAMHSP
jgi:hypothetical protein